MIIDRCPRDRAATRGERRRSRHLSGVLPGGKILFPLATARTARRRARSRNLRAATRVPFVSGKKAPYHGRRIRPPPEAMTLLDLYHTSLRARGFREEPAQRVVLAEMQRIADALAARAAAIPASTAKNTPRFARRFAATTRKAPPAAAVKGLYCWGEVGRGKTFLMDLLIEYLPTRRKRRRHFHRFMLEINDALAALGRIRDPIDEIVRRMGEEIDILCLDEFFVADITHAMLLERLLVAMGKNGITIVTTSNIAPEDLYRGGLQRARFLPAIAWIKEHLLVHHIGGHEDLRRLHARAEHGLRSQDNARTREALRRDLLALSGGATGGDPATVRVGSREIPVLWRNASSALFDFQILCAGNYSQKDYIEIARRFAYVGVVGVPVMDDRREDSARRFLLLVDEFYDRRVKLLLTTDAEIEKLYSGKRMAREFARLRSRLFAMQSRPYWDEAHHGG